uniref:Uncharacterized protein n=1 Tax=Tanacetum cinerariifolium TaxID=118510 RepID=A0A6L2LCW8_TANCI|nr:hypothetical protein [Tanacetum cinerariifolium]
MKLIIKHILFDHNNVSKRLQSYHHVIKIDATLGNLKFTNKGSKDLIYGIVISLEMMSDAIKDSVDYLNYLAKSKGDQPVKGQGKGLLTKYGVEVVVENIEIIWVPKRKRTETVIEETCQSEEVPNRPSDSSSSLLSRSDDEIEDISSDDERTNVDDSKKADEEKAKDEKAKEDKAGVEQTIYEQFIIDNPDVSLNDALKDLAKIEIQSIVDTTISPKQQPPQTQPKRIKTKLILKKSRKPEEKVNVVKRLTTLEKKDEAISNIDHSRSIKKHSRLMDDFDKFAVKEGESLESVYERLTTLVNIMDLKFKHHVLASKAKKDAKNHDPLALLAHSNASSSQSHANSSYSSQPYYVKHPSLVGDYKDEYQGDLRGDSQEDKLTIAMMLLSRVITQKVDIQTKNASYGGNGNRNAGRQNKNQALNKPRVLNAKYFREQMMLAMKDEAESNLKEEENDFMLDNSYGEETIEELTVAVMLMAQIQFADYNAETVPSYDAKAISEVNASFMVHEQLSHVKCKTIIQTSDDDQIDCSIIFDDSYMENRYLEDIVDLEEKLSSHDQIVYNMGQLLRTIEMLRKKPNKDYDPFLKARLVYKNPERLKKAIAEQLKMYDGERLRNAKLTIDSLDSEENLKGCGRKLIENEKQNGSNWL